MAQSHNTVKYVLPSRTAAPHGLSALPAAAKYSSNLPVLGTSVSDLGLQAKKGECACLDSKTAA